MSRPTRVETLIGRQAELASLDEFLTRVGIGPCALFLEGEAGIGKTRVWREGVEHARRGGARILLSQPSGSEVRLSFAGLADLLDGFIVDVLPELPPPQRHALEFALLLEDPNGVPPDDRAVAAAFLGCVRVLADAATVLIAVDDIQWLDPASARVLEFACRRLEAESVGVLAAVRIAPDEAEPTVGPYVRTRSSRVFGLGPLTIAGLYELIRVHLDIDLSRPALLAVQSCPRATRSSRSSSRARSSGQLRSWCRESRSRSRESARARPRSTRLASSLGGGHAQVCGCADSSDGACGGPRAWLADRAERDLELPPRRE